MFQIVLWFVILGIGPLGPLGPSNSRFPHFWRVKLHIALNTCKGICLVKQHCNGLLRTFLIVCQNFNKKVV